MPVSVKKTKVVVFFVCVCVLKLLSFPNGVRFSLLLLLLQITTILIIITIIISGNQCKAVCQPKADSLRGRKSQKRIM